LNLGAKVFPAANLGQTMRPPATKTPPGRSGTRRDLEVTNETLPGGAKRSNRTSSANRMNRTAA